MNTTTPETKCSHNYIDTKRVLEVPFNDYLSTASGYHTGVTKQEEIVIFCKKCGDMKIAPTNKPL